MTYLDVVEATDRQLSATGWETLRAHLDAARLEARRPAAQIGIDRHTQRVQQMLVAAALVSGAILAVAAVMLLTLL